MKKMIVMLSVIILKQIAYPQNTIGIPNIINYSEQDYKAGRQNMCIAQDSRGIMYFANNNGLLSFDGTFWRTYPLPNASMVRSVAIDNDKIYVGAQQEFGYFSAGANGELKYTSLRNLVKSTDNDFTDVWNIQIVQQHIFFRTNFKIFEYTGHTISVYNSDYWAFLGYTGEELLAYDYEKGLVCLKNKQWLPRLRPGSLPKGIQITSVTHIGTDSLLLTSESHGLFILKNNTASCFESAAIKEVAAKNIMGACLLAPGKIALNTSLGGCIVIDEKGKFIQRFTRNEGVQTNNVLCLFTDQHKNLWMGLDNGIDCISYNNAIKNIFPESPDRNSGHTSVIHNNQLYLGTASGLYKVKLSATDSDLSYTIGSFALVENTKGQVWNVSEVNGQLLLGHTKGAFWVNNNKAIAIDNRSGFWAFVPVYDSFPSSVFAAGTYTGVNFYRFKNNRIINPNLDVQFESARFVVRSNNIIWVVHPYKGLYMVSFNEQNHPVVIKYNDRKKILSKNHNHLYRLANKVVLTTDNGIFELDAKTNDFSPSQYFNQLFGSMRVDYLKEDSVGKIWFCSNKRVGVIDRSGTGSRVVYIPELDDQIMPNGFEHINIIDSNNVLIAAEKGFFHLNYALYSRSNHPVTTLIRMVQTAGKTEQIVYGGYTSSDKTSDAPDIYYSSNSLYFQCSAIVYGRHQRITYSYFLKGFDKDWSGYTSKAEREFTNLPPGHYVFQVKSRINYTSESAVAGFSFTILPPWYRTWWAYIVYTFLFGAMMYCFYIWQQNKFRRREQQKLLQQQQQYAEEQKQLTILHELEMRKSEKEIIQLRNDKLQSEIEHKNSQLASTAMNLVRKIEVFSKIKDDLNEFKGNHTLNGGLKDFEKIIRLISSELDVASEWEQFAEHFDQVHAHFLKKLKEHCPALTTTELKLAAYLRLNLTTKEIAHLMNISIRGVETARYRLRKKLGITSNDINLYDFLIAVTS